MNPLSGGTLSASDNAKTNTRMHSHDLDAFFNVKNEAHRLQNGSLGDPTIIKQITK